MEGGDTEITRSDHSMNSENLHEDFVSVKESECIPEDPREPEFGRKHDWVNVLGHERLRLKVHLT